LKNSFYW